MVAKTKNNSRMRQRTHKGVDTIMDKAESMRASGSEKMARFKRKTTQIKGNVDRHIQKNPERSVWIAGGIGFVAGTILTATLMRRKR